MMKDVIAYLIGYTTTKNDFKQEIHTETLVVVGAIGIGVKGICGKG